MQEENLGGIVEGPEDFPEIMKIVYTLSLKMAKNSV